MASGTNFVEALNSLEQNLSRRQWKKADMATSALLCAVVGKDREYLFTSDLTPKLIDHLVQVDQLWARHSRGKFGLSAQVDVLEECERDMKMFATEIGWLQDDFWISYRFATFSLAAPRGHLPIGGPHGLIFEDSGMFGRDIVEAFKAMYGDLRRPGGLWRYAKGIFKLKVLASDNPISAQDLGGGYEWIFGRIALLDFFRHQVPRAR